MKDKSLAHDILITKQTNTDMCMYVLVPMVDFMSIEAKEIPRQLEAFIQGFNQ